MIFRDHIQQIPFWQWIGENRENKRLLVLTGIAIFIQFIGYKYLYPYPNFSPDSYSYLEAAFNNQSINMWPIGYSGFLRLFSCFTKSHTALVLVQYILLQAAILYLLFTVAYLLTPGKWVVRILLSCSVLNPLLLPVSNFVSSDTLFTVLSLVWFTQLLWIMYRPGIRLLLVHSLVLLLAFMVRYNALYYPIISLLVIALQAMHIKIKLAGITAIIVLTGAFVQYTRSQYSTITGTAQFSAFGGWQLASNALFAYVHVPSDTLETVPAKFRTLHTTVNQHKDSLEHVSHRPDARLGIYYLWDEQAPLKKYMYYKYRMDSTTNGFKRWASMGPLYAQYGSYIIQRYPAAFIRYYLLPNMVNYYVPDAEFLAIYNMDSDSIAPVASAWFGLTNKVHSRSIGNRITVPDLFPVLMAVVNLMFVLSFIGLIFLSTFKKISLYFKRALWWTLLIWLCNLAFSVLASPIVLRYQLFPLVITFIFLVLQVASIMQEKKFAKIPMEENKDQNISARTSAQLT